ncbi:MAG: sigma-70 family RNA polymerase sigma factor [Actinomycetota bacterium]|nr:sigma-70 family RNA polymerase sigma factor [Actinomycetota bacterium]
MSRRTAVPDPDRRARYEAVFREVYEPLQRYVRRRVAAAAADDVVAEALTVLWRRLDDVPHDAVLAWSYGIARRCVANQRRSAGRHTHLIERVKADAAVSPGEPGDDPLLDVALSALPEADRELLHLWAWEGLQPREISVVLGISANAVSIRLHRAKQQLADQLRGKEPLRAGHEEVGHMKEAP